MPDPERPSGGARDWEEALAGMEHHLEEIRAGLELGGLLPGSPPTQLPASPLPPGLRERARALHAAQGALEQVLETRMSLLGAALAPRPAVARQVVAACFLDRRC